MNNHNHKHTALPESGRARRFAGCVAPRSCNRRAHGCIAWTQRCACGATREVASNLGHRELGAWEAQP